MCFMLQSCNSRWFGGIWVYFCIRSVNIYLLFGLHSQALLLVMQRHCWGETGRRPHDVWKYTKLAARWAGWHKDLPFFPQFHWKNMVGLKIEANASRISISAEDLELLLLLNTCQFSHTFSVCWVFALETAHLSFIYYDSSPNLFG